MTRLEKFTRATLLATAFLFTSGFAAVGLVALLFATAVEGLVTRRIPWRRSPADPALLAFAAAFFLVGIASPYRMIATGSAILSALTMYVAFGPLCRLLRQDKTFLRPFLWSWVAGGLLTAAWAVAVYRLTGHPPVSPSTTSLGTALLIAMVLSLGMFLATPSRWRFLAGVTAALAAVGLTLTYSRGAWLGGIAAIAIFLALTRLRFAVAVVSTILLVAMAGAMLTGADVSSLMHRLDSIFSVDANEARVNLARAAIAIFLDHPVFGTGMNTFSLVHPRYMSPRPNSFAFAHNIFLNMAAEGGAIGLMTFLAVVLTGLRSGWRWIKGASSMNDGIISATVFSAFIGLLVHEQFDGTMMTVHIGAGFWLLIAMQVAFRPQEVVPMERDLAVRREVT
jgi:O-antigen ligase